MTPGFASTPTTAWVCPEDGEVFTRFRDYREHIESRGERAVAWAGRAGTDQHVVVRSRRDWQEIVDTHRPDKFCESVGGCACTGDCRIDRCRECGGGWPCTPVVKAAWLLAQEPV